MTNVKNKQKVVVVINNNLRRKGGRKRNPLSKSQETIVKHHYYNQPNNAPTIIDRTREIEKDKEIAILKQETERNHKHIQNLANKIKERDEEISFKTPEKSTVKMSRHDPDIIVKKHPKITNYFNPDERD